MVVPSPFAVMESDEGSRALAETVGGGLGQVRQGGGQRAHVGGEHTDGRGHGPSIGLGLGDTGAGLDVGVERDRDGREDTDDGHHDHQLDEREAFLISQLRVARVLLVNHVGHSSWLSREKQGTPTLEWSAFLGYGSLQILTGR